MRYDYLIVGSGLFGSTFARLAADSGKRCLVIDKRPHPGGNIHCETIEGIHVHKYGPHIFHTSNPAVWEFVNRFVSFNRFTLMTVANYKGRLFNLPFNMNTFYQMWGVRTPDEAMRKMDEGRREVSSVRTLEDQAVSMVGRELFETLVKGYTEKQWGRACTDLPPSIIRRLPVRYTFDNNYFNDKYQGIPVGGYTPLIAGLLEGIDSMTRIDFFDGLDRSWRDIADKLVYTGKIDDFFHHRFGRLEYRSLRFETETLELPNYQGVALMNYTDRETPYTRVIEHKHFETFGSDVYYNPKTVITREYPSEYTPGNEAFYPVNDDANGRRYQKYKELAGKEKGVLFGGRLAEYRYYDMDQTISSAFDAWRQMGQSRAKECERYG